MTTNLVKNLTVGDRFNYNGNSYLIPVEAPPQEDIIIGSILGSAPVKKESTQETVFMGLATLVEVL